MIRTIRKLLAAVVSLLAAVMILITLLAHYTNHVIASPGNFSSRAVNLLHTDDVQSLIDQIVTDRVVADAGDQTRLQPVIQAAVTKALSSAALDNEFRAAANSLQAQLVSGTASELTLTLPNLGEAIASSIESESPELADEVRNIGSITVLNERIPPSDAKDVHDLVTAGSDSSELLIATFVLMLIALVISPKRRSTLIGIGLAAVISGVAAVVFYLGGRGVVVNEFSTVNGQLAARAIWSTYLSGLETWGIVLAAIGAAVSCAAALV